MEKSRAERIAKSIRDAQNAVDTAATELGTRVSRDAADLCHMYLTEAQVHLGLHVLAQLWEEFPDLAPPSSDESTFRRCTVPAAEMAPLRQAVAVLSRVIGEAKALVDEGASTPGERWGYLTALTETRTKLQEVDARLAELET